MRISDWSSDVCSSDLEEGLFRRFGLVLKHRALGFRANAMLVMDIPDAQVDEVGRRLGQAAGVNLCYQRPRRLPQWPYNLFCMVHGREREQVCQLIERLLADNGLSDEIGRASSRERVCQ